MAVTRRGLVIAAVVIIALVVIVPIVLVATAGTR
jgi:hypothetical protein